MSSAGPSHAAGYCQAARQSLQQGNVDQAIALLQEALARDPRSAEAHTLLGVAYAQKGMVDEGIQALSTAVSLDPNSASAHMNLAAALQRTGRLREAVAELNEALRIDPNYQKAQEALSAIQEQLQQQGATMPAPPPPVTSSWEQTTSTGVSCPSCKAGNSPDASFCWQCGQSLKGGVPQPTATADMAKPFAPSPGWSAPGDVPFEARERYGGFLGALWETWREACFSPNVFFTKVGQSSDLGAPFLFAFICIAIGAVIGLTFQVGFRSLGMGMFGMRQPPGATMLFSMGMPVLIMAVYRVIALVLWVVLILIIHLCLMVFGGATKGVTMTLRVFGYVFATQIFNIIPCGGPWIALIWGIVLAILGLARAHETDEWRTALAVFMPAVVCCGLGIVGSAAIFGLAGSGVFR